MALVLTEASMPDAAGTAIDVGQFATPCLYDLDADGDLDLLVGEKNGGLSLFENTGSVNAASFTFLTAAAGQVDADNLLGINGFPVPAVWPTDSGLTLVIGNELGHLQLYAFPPSPMEEPEAEWTEVTGPVAGALRGRICRTGFGRSRRRWHLRPRGWGAQWRPDLVERACTGARVPRAAHPMSSTSSTIWNLPTQGWQPYPNPLCAGNCSRCRRPL